VEKKKEKCIHLIPFFRGGGGGGGGGGGCCGKTSFIRGFRGEKEANARFSCTSTLTTIQDITQGERDAVLTSSKRKASTSLSLKNLSGRQISQPFLSSKQHKQKVTQAPKRKGEGGEAGHSGRSVPYQ